MVNVTKASPIIYLTDGVGVAKGTSQRMVNALEQVGWWRISRAEYRAKLAEIERQDAHATASDGD